MSQSGQGSLRGVRRWAGPWLACLAVLLSATASAQDSAVSLPPFLVEEAAKGPPWRHGEAMGFEILSRCADATTRRVVEAQIGRAHV